MYTFVHVLMIQSFIISALQMVKYSFAVAKKLPFSAVHFLI